MDFHTPDNLWFFLGVGEGGGRGEEHAEAEKRKFFFLSPVWLFSCYLFMRFAFGRGGWEGRFGLLSDGREVR